MAGYDCGPPPRICALADALIRRYQVEGALVPKRVLELCRLRIAANHDCAAEWTVRDVGIVIDEAETASLKRGDLAGFTVSEQAALAIAEQMPFQHHRVSDANVAAAAEVFGEAGTIALMVALAFFDATCRWKLAFDLEEWPVDLESPPLHRGALA